MIDTAAILGDTRAQKAIARQMAQMRASGSWKANAIDAIFNTMAQGRERDRLAALRTLADKESQAEALRRSQTQFNQRYDLARGRMNQAEGDSQMANIVSGVGAVSQGYAGYKDYQDNKRLAAEINDLRRRQYGG